ncbi:oocyte zinc finger protein XlCOF8.4-like [Oppia nitens]|uniref:oocyte zinc finger protein XlCOF8.4-like n=1 Tax=Oppia nitens TaxID=1686743 RepID=UPI0023DB870B|nr:oocyte zinc finger protein XlCOF8.4-like [Oppia nitens]
MPRKYVCDWIGCGKPFSQRANLEIHIRSQHTKETPFTCEDCGKVFTNKSCLKSHTALHSSDMKFICKHVGCGYKTRTPQALYRHQLTHRPKRPTIIGEQRRKRINKLNYSCEVVGCTKQFQRHEQLVAHIRNRHTNERPFRCDLCDTRFVIERYVDIHKRTVHSDAPLMKCTLDGCAYETRFQSRLDQHLRRHDGNPEFVCPNHGCGKQFYTKRSLNLHLQSHSDERPFPCNWPGCDKRFKNNQQLKVHLERHSGVRSYRCSLPGCDKSYTTHKGLEQHSRSHSIPYQCTWPACEARFQNSSKLKDHMNGHQGIKPFNCHFQGCDVSYSSKDSLRMHWRQTHKYIKTYHDKT